MTPQEARNWLATTDLGKANDAQIEAATLTADPDLFVAQDAAGYFLMFRDRRGEYPLPCDEATYSTRREALLALADEIIGAS